LKLPEYFISTSVRHRNLIDFQQIITRLSISCLLFSWNVHVSLLFWRYFHFLIRLGLS